MSKTDGQRRLRQLECDGCEQHCKYVQFRAFGPLAGSFAPPRKRDYKREAQRRKKVNAARATGVPLPHGNSGPGKPGRAEFEEVSQDVACEVRRRLETGEGLARTVGRPTVLGRMHRTKMDLWLDYTRNCPYHAYTTDDTADGAAEPLTAAGGSKE